MRLPPAVGANFSVMTFHHLLSFQILLPDLQIQFFKPEKQVTKYCVTALKEQLFSKYKTRFCVFFGKKVVVQSLAQCRAFYHFLPNFSTL